MIDQPGTKQPAPALVPFAKMESFLLGEAHRIEVTQNALISAGMRSEPDPDAMRNKEICEALFRLVGLCRTEVVGAALKRAAKASA